ncbi:MAG: HemK family protein methyltransferase [bacterium]|nr:HemK family protein methyltransferase [bacterium]
MDKEIRWLLKDKYNFSENQIANFSSSTASLNILDDLKRLEKGEPINYVIGWQEFLDCKIDLSFKPLIPRVETEFWVKNAIDDLTTKHFSTSVERYNLKTLDLCCGSGCIGIAILKHLPNSFVTFSDISDNAINQTKLNLNLNNIENSRYKIIKSDLFKKIDDKFDLIFANPPYVDKNGLVPESLKFEPEIAIFANDNGIEIIKIILNDFEQFLNTNGQLFMEFGYKQDDIIKKILLNHNKVNLTFIKDQYDIERVLHYRF